MTAKSKNRIWGWTKFFVYLFGIASLLVLLGFINFTRTVKKLEAPALVPDADGIVVWTGKESDRLMVGAQLLQKGHGERLLISGVNQSVSAEELHELLGLPDETNDCCVDLDYEAEDTIGNARETASWSKAMGYEHIILVTSAYHMPRAQTEIGAVAGRIKITPYPVTSDRKTDWLKNRETFRHLSREYGKYLLTSFRQAGTPEERDTPRLDNIPAAE